VTWPVEETSLIHIGMQLTPFFSPIDCPPTQVVNEVVAIARWAS
jgi:hypothetical protein